MLADLISHTLICPMGKTKIDNFHVFDIHWLYRTSRYAIIKVDDTDCNDITKCYFIVIIIWWTSAIEVIKNSLSEMKGMKEKESIMGVTDRKSPSLRITVWHHSASFVIPDSYLGRIFPSTPNTHDRFL